MANQPETATYDAGVYQLQTIDPVQGGVGGLSNAPLLNLANRTAYLKVHVDALESASASLAPINSPTFTGTPAGPTPAAGDNSTKFATTAFVRFLNDGIAAITGLTNANVTLTAAQYGAGIITLAGALTGNINIVFPVSGKWLVFNNTSGAFTITLKTAAGTGVSVAQGKSNFINSDGTNVVISRSDFNNIALTGSPSAPTPAVGDNSTSIATTAFTQSAVIRPNKIINGDISIDQRNAGASVSFTNVQAFGADRFTGISSGLTTQTIAMQQVASSISVCTKTLKFTVGGTGAAPAAAAFAIGLQKIEGVNIADLLWGTAGAKPIAVSFLAKASVTGTYAVSIRNAATTRAYIASFAMTAGVETFVSLQIPGDTTGTWATDNGIGLLMQFDLGVGSSGSTTSGSWQAGSFSGLTGGTKLIATTGATFEVGNIKLEQSSGATPFVPDDCAVSLTKCLRYCYVWNKDSNSFGLVGPAWGNTATQAQSMCELPVEMRVVPSMTQVSTFTMGNYYNGTGGSLNPVTSVAIDGTSTRKTASLTTSPVVTSLVGQLYCTSSSSRLIFNAEL